MPAPSRDADSVATEQSNGFGLPVHTAALPYWAKNRSQRVHDRGCAACGGLVYRARRGPAPRHCVPCAVGLRRRQQLRAYLCSAERLARAVGAPDVADAAGAAVALLDATRHE